MRKKVFTKTVEDYTERNLNAFLLNSQRHMNQQNTKTVNKAIHRMQYIDTNYARENVATPLINKEFVNLQGEKAI